MVCVLFAIAVLAAVAGARPQGGYDLYQQALSRERAEGKLAEAIALYDRVVREFAGDRALAAKALLRLGECHEKLGDAESRKAYERLVRDFADQKDAAKQARARLNAMGAGSPAPSSVSSRMLWTAPRHATLDNVSPDGTGVPPARQLLADEGFAQPFGQSRLQGKPALLRADIGQFIPLGVGISGTLYSSVDNNWEGSDVRIGAFDFSSGRWITPAADAVQQFAGGGARTPAWNPTPDWSPDSQSLLAKKRPAPAKK
jgi:hypothetical protein